MCTRARTIPTSFIPSSRHIHWIPLPIQRSIAPQRPARDEPSMVPPAAEEAPPKPSAASSWRERRRALRRKREAEEGDIETGGAGDDGLALLGGGGIGGGSGGASYTSAAKRARMEREAVLLGAGAEAAGGDGGPSSSSSLPGRIREARARKALAALGAGAPRQDQDQRERERREEDGTVEGWPAKKEEAAGEGGEGGAGSDGENDGGGAVTSLLEQAEALKEKRDLLSEAERNALDKKGDEDRILREASQVQTNALQAASRLTIPPMGPSLHPPTNTPSIQTAGTLVLPTRSAISARMALPSPSSSSSTTVYLAPFPSSTALAWTQ